MNFPILQFKFLQNPIILVHFLIYVYAPMVRDLHFSPIMTILPFLFYFIVDLHFSPIMAILLPFLFYICSDLHF